MTDIEFLRFDVRSARRQRVSSTLYSQGPKMTADSVAVCSITVREPADGPAEDSSRRTWREELSRLAASSRRSKRSTVVTSMR